MYGGSVANDVQCAQAGSRDCMDLNIMMDATTLYKDPYHPCDLTMKRDYTGFARHYTRTQRPPKYFFIDFGISRRYSPDNPAPLEHPIQGGDKSVPGFQESDAPCNPFPTDVYYLGNMIREEFISVSGNVVYAPVSRT